MIIWINGAFGSGKTQTAYELRYRLPGSCVYDPENAGFFLQKNLPPSVRLDDFQDYPMWRTVNRDTLDYLARHHSGHIIVPMTVTRRDYYDKIIGELSQRHELKHFILYADRETLLRRLAFRLGGKKSWAARQIDRCIRAFDERITEIKIDTRNLDIGQTAEKIAGLAGIPLLEDRRSGLRKRLSRIAVQCGHIR